MFFSATMPDEIDKLSRTILNNPLKVVVTPVSSTVEIIDQSVYFVDKGNKTNLLIHLLKDKSIVSALVFARTKHGSNKIVKSLVSAGIKSEAIHGNKSQNARQLALDNFKKGKTRVLVATDIAARGIDIVELSHVINYNLSEVAETYVHRIGRTGRASLGGTAISFCAYDEKPLLRDIQKLISKEIREVKDHPYPLVETVIPEKQQQKQQRRRPNTNKNKKSGSSRGYRQSNSSSKKRTKSK